jgi:hypothetical protein
MQDVGFQNILQTEEQKERVLPEEQSRLLNSLNTACQLSSPSDIELGTFHEKVLLADEDLSQRS